MRKRSRTYPLPLNTSTTQPTPGTDSVIQWVKHYHQVDARSFCYVRSYNEVWCGQKDGNIIIRNASNASIVTTLVGTISESFQCRTARSQRTHVVVFTIVGQNMWCGCANGQIQIWSIRKRCLLKNCDSCHSAPITDMTLCLNGVIISVSADGTIKYWNEEGELVHTSFGLKGWINSVICVGERVWSGSDDGNVRLWNMSGSILFEEKVHENSILQLVYDAENDRIWSSCKGGMINVWNIENDSLVLVKSVCCLNSIINCLHIANGLVLAASNDKKIRVFRASNAEQVHELVILKGYVHAMISIKNFMWMSFSNRSIHVYKFQRSSEGLIEDVWSESTTSLEFLDYSVISEYPEDFNSTITLSPIKTQARHAERSLFSPMNTPKKENFKDNSDLFYASLLSLDQSKHLLEVSLKEVEEKEKTLDQQKKILNDSIHEVKQEKIKFISEKLKFETEIKQIQANVEMQRIHFVEREEELNKRLFFVESQRVELKNSIPFQPTKTLSEIVRSMVIRLNRTYLHSSYPYELEQQFNKVEKKI